MDKHLGGGCACGAVRYDFTGEVEFAFHCFCRKCQRATGSGHASAFALARSDVSLSGPIKYFEHKADSGYATYSGFCPNCGSPIVSKASRFPDRLYFYAATLDDPGSFEAQFAVFEDSAQPWDRVDFKPDQTAAP